MARVVGNTKGFISGVGKLFSAYMMFQPSVSFFFLCEGGGRGNVPSGFTLTAHVFSYKLGSLSKHDVDAEARTSSENITSPFCNNFSIIQSHFA